MHPDQLQNLRRHREELRRHKHQAQRHFWREQLLPQLHRPIPHPGVVESPLPQPCNRVILLHK